MSLRLNARTLTCLFLILLGTFGILMYFRTGDIYLALGGVAAIVLSYIFLRPGAAIVVALAAGFSSITYIVWRAGPLWSFSAYEWLLIVGSIVLWLLSALMISGAMKLARIWRMFLVIPVGTVLFLAISGLNNNLIDIKTYSIYVPMRDKVKLAVTVNLPREYDRKTGLPTILLQTRYFRAVDYRFPYNLLRPLPGGPSPNINALVRNGYAYVALDVRGTGASYGFRSTLFGDEELKDGKEIVDWIIAQPWSNGQIGLEGVSYNGTAAEFLLAQQHPAIKAVMPQFSLYDAYSDIIFPGGIFLENFVKTWSQYSYYLDRNKLGDLLGASYKKYFAGVRPVDDDWGGRQLSEAISGHENNFDPYTVMTSIRFKDDTAGEFSVKEMSTYAKQEKIKATGVPIYSVSGWLDGGYQYAAIKRYLTTSTPGSRLLIGPWDHGGGQNISPCKDGSGERFDSKKEAVKFFNYYLKGGQGDFAEEAPIKYFTMCAEEWKSASVWPPVASMTQYYFSPQGKLRETAPDISVGRDRYQVDNIATSGTQSRWVSYVNTKRVKIGYPERSEQNEKLLSYTSDPLDVDTEVTGHPMVVIHLSSSEADGQLFVYLEDIGPDGNIAYVTEGQLRLIHREIGSSKAPYQQPTPYRTFLEADALPMEKGEPAEIRLDLWPTSYLFRKGHRIRVSIGGADYDNFALPEGQLPEYEIYRQTGLASKIVLPVIKDQTREKAAGEIGEREVN